jgi:hypothetical protein
LRFEILKKPMNRAKLNQIKPWAFAISDLRIAIYEPIAWSAWSREMCESRVLADQAPLSGSLLLWGGERASGRGLLDGCGVKAAFCEIEKKPMKSPMPDGQSKLSQIKPPHARNDECQNNATWCTRFVIRI